MNKPVYEEIRSKLAPWDKSNELAKLKLKLHLAKRDLYSKRYKSRTLISSKVRIVQQIEKKIKEVLKCKSK